MDTSHPPDHVGHPDLAAEQAHVAHAYACLVAMRDTTRAATDAAAAAGAAGEVDSTIAGAHLAQRLRGLDPDVGGLVFGRIDEESGAAWHVGRRHVEDTAGDPVVVDWRAPVSVPFYRATPIDPLDLRRRRRFLLDGKEVEDIFDEVFDDPDLGGEVRAAGIPDPLLAELERTRTGAMRDIVATIAGEQDAVIRADIDACLVVQGGPGTGKTAVGLHRAAYLLYEHRERLDRDGMLVVGPNPLFLRYIAQVLPSLGEFAARQTTLDRLVAGVVGGRVGPDDPPARARVLGDARMAEVVSRGLLAMRRRPTDDLVLTTQWGRVRITVDEIAAVLDDIARRGVPWSIGRAAIRTQLVGLAVSRHRARQPDDAVADGFEAAIRSSADLRQGLTRWWPNTSGPALVRRLLTSRAALRRAAEGLLSGEEQELMSRRAAARLDDERWTPAELTVVDEAVALVDGVARTYGHVVVDEAQDLSPMALRALGRRCPTASLTVLGDLAQATAPAATGSWEAALAHLGSPATTSVEELSVGYRVPAAVMDLANRLLPRVAPDLRPAVSVRTGGRAPRVVAAADLAATAAAEVASLADDWGSVGVVVPTGLADVVMAALGTAGVDVGRGARAVTGTAVSLVSPPEAKGLEFDAVAVVEPDAFADDAIDERSAGRLLYIALTRAVQELVIVHAAPLPAELAS